MIFIAGLSACSKVPTTTSQLSAEEEKEEQHERYVRTGFAPTADLIAKKVEVQRAEFMIGLEYLVSVELRRASQGQPTVTLHSGGNRRTAAIPVGEWLDLASNKLSAFRSISTQKARKREEVIRREGAYCHYWTTIETTLGLIARRQDIDLCYGNFQPVAHLYAERIARVVLARIPDCAPQRAIPITQDALEGCAISLGPETETYKRAVAGLASSQNHDFSVD